MANEQNLTRMGKARGLTSEEAKRIGSIGGKKSVEARKEKKLFKEELCKRLGFKDFEEIMDNLIQRAKKDDKSFEVLRDTMGQKPTDKVKFDGKLSYEEYIKKVEDKDEY